MEDSSILRGKSIRSIDPESGYDNPEEALSAEEQALLIDTSISPKVLPTRDYINSTLSEVILKGLHELDVCRPENPVEFFAYYLLKHNPNT